MKRNEKYDETVNVFIYIYKVERERERKEEIISSLSPADISPLLFFFFPMLMQWLLPVLQPPEMPEEGCRQGSGHHTHCPPGLLRQQKRVSRYKKDTRRWENWSLTLV